MAYVFSSVQSLSHVQLFATPWTAACQVPLCMGFSSQENWSGLPCLFLRDLPGPGIEPMSLMSPALAGGSLSLLPSGKSHGICKPTIFKK